MRHDSSKEKHLNDEQKEQMIVPVHMSKSDE